MNFAFLGFDRAEGPRLIAIRLRGDSRCPTLYRGAVNPARADGDDLKGAQDGRRGRPGARHAERLMEAQSVAENQKAN